MNKEKMEEVSNMLALESSDVIDSKVKRIFKGMIFPLIQVGFYLTSSLLGIVFGHWENNSQSTYPYGPFGGLARAYIWGPVALVGISSGNLALSVTTRKRIGLHTLVAVATVLVNLALSLTSFFLLYKYIETEPQSTFMGIVPLYNVHSREKPEVSKMIEV